MNEAIISSILTSGIASAAITFLLREWISNRIKNSIQHEYSVSLERLKSDLQIQSNVLNSKWDLKYSACMNALDLADAILSNLNWEGPNSERINNETVKETVSTVSVRDCINQLACTCESGNVLGVFRKIVMAEKGITMDIIVDLRNEVRKELGFSKSIIDTERQIAFVGRSSGDEIR